MTGIRAAKEPPAFRWVIDKKKRSLVVSGSAGAGWLYKLPDAHKTTHF